MIDYFIVGFALGFVLNILLHELCMEIFGYIRIQKEVDNARTKLLRILIQESKEDGL